jgi:hypothetical protein
VSPRLRKFALTTHIVSSVGWLGAVAAFLALAIVGVASDERQTVVSSYIAMESTGWFILVPLAIAAFVSGLVQALGSKWGLFRHYWVLAKLLITVVATIILLLYMQTLGTFADRAEATAATSGIGHLRSASPVLHATGALLLLLTAAALSVYKPRGITRYGWRKQQERRTD